MFPNSRGPPVSTAPRCTLSAPPDHGDVPHHLGVGAVDLGVQARRQLLLLLLLLMWPSLRAELLTDAL